MALGAFTCLDYVLHTCTAGNETLGTQFNHSTHINRNIISYKHALLFLNTINISVKSTKNQIKERLHLPLSRAGAEARFCTRQYPGGNVVAGARLRLKECKLTGMAHSKVKGSIE